MLSEVRIGFPTRIVSFWGSKRLKAFSRLRSLSWPRTPVLLEARLLTEISNQFSRDLALSCISLDISQTSNNTSWLEISGNYRKQSVSTQGWLTVFRRQRHPTGPTNAHTALFESRDKNHCSMLSIISIFLVLSLNNRTSIHDDVIKNVISIVP